MGTYTKQQQKKFQGKNIKFFNKVNCKSFIYIGER